MKLTSVLPFVKKRLTDLGKSKNTCKMSSDFSNYRQSYYINHHRFSIEIISILCFTFFVIGSLSAQNYKLDQSFGENGISYLKTLSSDEIKVIEVINDEDIIVAGYASGSNGYHFQIARFTNEGLPNLSFGINGIVNTIIENRSIPTAIEVQLDGKIIVGGTALANSESPFVYLSTLVRYNIDGSLDQTFGTNGIILSSIDSVSNIVSDFKIQPDGRIVSVGYIGYRCFLTRRNNDGSLDTSFGDNGRLIIELGEESSLYAMNIYDDGKILAIGSVRISGNSDFLLFKFNPDGTFDENFGDQGIVQTQLNPNCLDIATSLKVLLNGQILLAGYSGCRGALLAKYNANGTLDYNFGINGIASLDNIPEVPQNGIEVNLFEQIILCGSTLQSAFNFDYQITYLNEFGELDTNDNHTHKLIVNPSIYNDYAQCITQYSNGKLLIGGSSKNAEGDSDFTIVRLESTLTEIEGFLLEVHPELKITYHEMNNSVVFSLKENFDKIYMLKLYDQQGKKIKEINFVNELVLHAEEFSDSLILYQLIDNSNQQVIKSGKVVFMD